MINTNFRADNKIPTLVTDPRKHSSVLPKGFKSNTLNPTHCLPKTGCYLFVTPLKYFCRKIGPEISYAAIKQPFRNIQAFLVFFSTTWGFMRRTKTKANKQKPQQQNKEEKREREIRSTVEMVALKKLDWELLFLRERVHTT